MTSASTALRARAKFNTTASLGQTASVHLLSERFRVGKNSLGTNTYKSCIWLIGLEKTI
jgi:hypothetical protein